MFMMDSAGWPQNQNNVTVTLYRYSYNIAIDLNYSCNLIN